MSKKKKVSLSWALKEFVWPRRSSLSLGLLLIILRSSSGLVAPYSSKILLDEVVPNKNLELLANLLIVVCLALIIQAASSYALTRLLSVEAQLMIAKLRVKVAKKLLKLPIQFFDENKSGALVSRVMSDVEGVRNLVGTGFVQLIGGTLTAIGALFILIKINLWMTIFVLVPISLFAIIALKAFGYIRPIFRVRGKINAQVKGRLTETLNGVRVIKAFNAEDQETKTFEKGVDKLYKNVKKSLTTNAIIQSSATLLLGLASAGILGIGGYFMAGGSLSPGDFLAFVGVLGFMIIPIVQMGNIGSQLTEALAGLDRTQELMNMKEEYDETRTIEINNIKGNIEFKGVSFSYGLGKEVIHDIQFKAPAGSVTALVGSSGSGKSTIAGLAASFMKPSKGIITLDNKDLSKIKLQSYRRNLGVVLQDDFLFEGTIRENILFPRPNATEAQLESAVKSAYVDEFTQKFEQGLDTLIGERGVKLSGGQKQRISIARALLADPKIIILDEATSNLDTESETFIQKSLSFLMENRTTFVIAHRLSTIRQADQIIVIEDGLIFEQGTHEELLRKKGRYHDLYKYQSRI